MNRFFLLFSLVGVSAVSAMAATVSFDTLGSTLCVGSGPCSSTSWVGTNTTVTYLAASSNTVNTPSFSNLGSIQVTCISGGTSCASDTLPANLVLHINIDQSSPTVGSSVIPAGSLTGTISGNGSQAQINWTAGTSTTIGYVNYTVTNLPLNLVPPTTNNGITTIQASVNAPEPGSLMLLGSGLAGLFFARRRKA